MAKEIITRAQAKARGLKRYFTGKPCKHGHICERHSDGSCYECRRTLCAQYYQRNSEDIKAHVNARYHANPEPVIAYSMRWAKENRDRQRRNHREWSKKNFDKVMANSRNQQARRRGAEGSHTQEEILEIFKAQRGRCVYCSVKLTRANRHLDHIVSIKRGGSNDKSNLQWLCQSCNQRKNAKDHLEFAKELGRLL